MFISINGIPFETVSITPKMASKMLKHNNYNRSRSNEDVDKIVSRMVNGEWNKETVQIFKVSSSGELLDGQTRLRAIVKLGTEMENCLIITGETMKAIEEIDTGCPRSIRQRFETSPRFDQKDLKHVKWLGPLLNLPVNKFSTEKAFVLFQQYAETCRAISEMRGSKIFNKNLRPNIIWATIGRAYWGGKTDEARERVRHFAEVLHTGAIYSEGDRAAIVLRDYLSNLEVEKSKENRTVSVCGGSAGQDFLRNAVINALYWFLEHKAPIKKLKPAPSDYLRFTHELS